MAKLNPWIIIGVIIVAFVIIKFAPNLLGTQSVAPGVQYCNLQQCDTNQATVINQRGICENAGYTCTISQSGTPTNYCVNCGGGTCSLTNPSACTQVGKRCMSTSQLCNNAFIYNGNYYCDVDDYVDCPCTNNACAVKTCTSPLGAIGDEQCGLGSYYDSAADPYRCDGTGNWVKDDTCADSEICYESSMTSAYCKQILNKWCYDYQSFKCGQTCTSGYNTEAECSVAKEWCYCVVGSECVKKIGDENCGSCARGTDEVSVKATCEAQLPTKCSEATDSGGIAYFTVGQKRVCQIGDCPGVKECGSGGVWGTCIKNDASCGTPTPPDPGDCPASFELNLASITSFLTMGGIGWESSPAKCIPSGCNILKEAPLSKDMTCCSGSIYDNSGGPVTILGVKVEWGQCTQVTGVCKYFTPVHGILYDLAGEDVAQHYCTIVFVLLALILIPLLKDMMR